MNQGRCLHIGSWSIRFVLCAILYCLLREYHIFLVLILWRHLPIPLHLRYFSICVNVVVVPFRGLSWVATTSLLPFLCESPCPTSIGIPRSPIRNCPSSANKSKYITVIRNSRRLRIHQSYIGLPIMPPITKWRGLCFWMSRKTRIG